MPRNVKTKGIRKKYDKNNLKEALDAICSGMTRKQAAKLFQVPRSTIQFRLNNPTKINPRPGPSTVLTDMEEDTLADWIIQSSRKGFRHRKEDIQWSVTDLFKINADRLNPFKNELPGAKWVNLFLKRHPEIDIRTSESSASSVVKEGDIRSWFCNIANYLRGNAFFDILSDPSRVLNGDETKFSLCPKTGVVLGFKDTKNVHVKDKGQAKSVITVMFTSCANGDLTPPMIVLPFKRLPEGIASKTPKKWGIGLSDKGCSNADIFYDYIKNVLHPHFLKEDKIFPVILFVDGTKTQLTLKVSELCSDMKIILIALYPNCSRILQPEDVAAFFPLKHAWKKSILQWRQDNPAKALTKVRFVQILKTAIEVFIKPDKIINGFRASGLHPWNADALDYSKCLRYSKGKQTEQPYFIENTTRGKSQMTQEEFINIVGMDTVNKLNRNDLHMIHNASQILQNLWVFFGNSSNTSVLHDGMEKIEYLETSSNVSSDLLLEEQQECEDMEEVYLDLSESSDEGSIITVHD